MTLEGFCGQKRPFQSTPDLNSGLWVLRWVTMALIHTAPLPPHSPAIQNVSTSRSLRRVPVSARALSATSKVQVPEGSLPFRLVRAGWLTPP